MIEYLFHVTPGNNVESILVHGIIPGYKQGLNRGYPERKPFVWLTDNPEYILKTQAGQTWIDHRNPKVIRVDCSNLDVKHFRNFEWFYDKIITKGLKV